MGTIAQKGEYLEETKGLIAESINNLGGSITSETTFREYAQELDTIYSNLPKVTGEGTEVTLSPTLKGKLGIVEKGNSTQEGTPTPDTPIPIKSVTGNNNVVVNNKNICTSASKFNNNYLQFGLDKTMLEKTFTLSFITDVSLSNNSIIIYEGSTQLYSFANKLTGNANERVSGSITLTDAQYETIQNATGTITLRAYKSSANWTSVTNAQIENGDTATNYVAKASQTLPLNLGNIELNGIDTYKDLMFKNIPSSPYYNNTLTEGNWYKYEIIKKIVLNGSEEWSLFFNTTGLYRYTPDPISREIDASINCLCNYYQGTTRTNIRNNLGTVDNVCATFKNELIIANKSITSINDFKTWLGTHNTVVDYILNTPTYTEITDTTLISQLEDIDKLMGYNGTTIITSTFEEGNAQMIISASALKGE